MKVLCVHGVGHAEADPSLPWQLQWRTAIARGITTTHPDATLDPENDIHFTAYDDLFNDAVNSLTPVEIGQAAVLLSGGLIHRGLNLANVSDEAKWTAGMVIVWVQNADARNAAWQRFLSDVATVNPDLICAHSLGTLIAYDGFRRQESTLQGRTLLTFGSQLGNPFVRGQFAGRVGPFAAASFWYHLYNPHDHVFTAALDFGPFQTADNFQQTVAPFGGDWFWELNHDAVSPDPNAPDKGYLTHSEAAAQVWPRITVRSPLAAAAVAATPAMPRAMQLVVQKSAKVLDAPKRRALLVGINTYPDPANRLEGCVNDVFLMSSVLQECGFEADDIRVVLDERATSAGILERLHWLLDGTASGDQRVFYYSGHGAQLPAYGVDGKIQRVDACLVPYDFDWSPATALTDDKLVNLYSLLPYDAHFMMILDSCYSGAMTRGNPHIRGLDPPDDIRHRMLRWDRAAQMWVARDLPSGNQQLAENEASRMYLGAPQGIRTLGRAASLRTVPNARYDELCKDLKHQGPFLPIIYEACGPQEFAYEYQHGVTSYGAFTYALATMLRRQEALGQALTFAQLLEMTSETLNAHHYPQHPVLVGPRPLLQKPIPWQTT